MKKQISIQMNDIKDFQRFSQIAVNSEHPVTIKAGSNVVDAHSLLRIFTIDWSKPVEVEYDENDTRVDKFLESFQA